MSIDLKRVGSMPSCPECDGDLDLNLDQVEERDEVTCNECGAEYEVTRLEPLELKRVVDEKEEEE
jgi:alpha-aminoadipate carrier protein LysW